MTNWQTQLDKLREEISALRSFEIWIIADARQNGCSWTDIGKYYEISRQEAHRRYSGSVNALEATEVHFRCNVCSKPLKGDRRTYEWQSEDGTTHIEMRCAIHQNVDQRPEE